MSRVVDVWTHDRIIAALQEWHRTHGRVPTSMDWRVSGLWEHPTAQTVHVAFGSWNMGLVAAGFPARKQGPRRLIGVAA